MKVKPIPSPETQLAYLGFQRIAPHPALQAYVQSYWHLRRATPLLAYAEEYMHPGGGFGIVFNLGAQLRLDAQVVTEPVFLDGANTVSRKMGFIGQVELMGIRFREGGAFPFLGLPLYELRNEIALLEAVDRPNLLRVHERLLATEALAARVALLEEWLIGRLVAGKKPDELVPASLAHLRAYGGQVSIPALAQEFAIGQRQLERLFQNQVGMPPKQYAQLVRVERARQALKNLGQHTGADLAAELGYSDQAHFIREFKSVTGITPVAYAKRRHE